MTTFQIKNSVAFVTGTNRRNGIGRAIVEALLKNGARKVYATARSVAQLEELVTSSAGRVEAVALNVTDAAAVAQLGERYPDVQLLVNNAGLFTASPALGSAEDAINEIAVNYTAPLLITQSFSKGLQGQSQSAVVNINSIASLVNFPLGGTYSASKAASHSLTQAQRRELSGSLVVGVYPGPIDTDLAEGIPMEKVSASVVADAIVRALESGTEDVFPDPTSEQMYASWKADAKGMEQQMAQFAATAE
jgi:NAD(P)-dependent dehydrogenase (short-subunit alcohol dehydrogenase family)